MDRAGEKAKQGCGLSWRGTSAEPVGALQHSLYLKESMSHCPGKLTDFPCIKKWLRPWPV